MHAVSLRPLLGSLVGRSLKSGLEVDRAVLKSSTLSNSWSLPYPSMLAVDPGLEGKLNGGGFGKRVSSWTALGCGVHYWSTLGIPQLSDSSFFIPKIAPAEMTNDGVCFGGEVLMEIQDCGTSEAKHAALSGHGRASRRTDLSPRHPGLYPILPMF